MLNGIIDFSLRNRALVIFLTLAAAAVGAVSVPYLNIDAFPDTSPISVQINTAAPGLTPEEVELQITYPIEQTIGGLPGLTDVRSTSKFGLSQVVVLFEDDIDIYFARQLLNERLATITMPTNIERPKLGPVATGLGEVFHYTVSYDGYDFSTMPKPQREEMLTELRTIHDWVIVPQLRTVPGVAEANSWGGTKKQFQVRIDPELLLKYDLTFQEVVTALEMNNRNVGGGFLLRGSEAPLIHGVGRVENVEEIEQIVIKAIDGVPVTIDNVAEVMIGYEIRRGAATADGKGEVVLGLGFMLMGENPHAVTRRLKEKLAEIEPTLPPGVKLTLLYDRTELVDFVMDTVRSNLFEGGLLVIAILFALLGNLRGALIVALAIPLSMLFAFSGMLRFGIAASLLSLGALDFGMIVDSSVVMVENCVRRLAHDSTLNKREVIRQAAMEVRRPTLFGELIIMVVYLPILTLQGIEGKLFRPMALTVIFALAGSMILSLTLMPVLASLVLPRRVREHEPLLMRLARWIYMPMLDFTMRFKLLVIVLTLCIAVVAFGMIAPNLGAEFVPRLSEGAVAMNIVRLAGTDIDESVRYNTRMEKAILAEFPDEVNHVWSRIGAAEVATDPMGLELTDMYVSLKPRSQWTKASTQAELTTLIEQTLRDMPGQEVAYTQPIEMRISEMDTGIRSDIGVKLYGDDYDIMVRKSAEIEAVLNSIEGSADVTTEQVTGQPVLRIEMRQDQLARYGVPAKTVLDMIESLGAMPVGEVFQGQYRFPLVVRLPDKYRENKEAIESMLIRTAGGERIPLARLATVSYTTGPSTITREAYQRKVTTTCNVRGRDMVGFVNEVKRRLKDEVELPPGRYHIEIGGQFEHYESARDRLLIVVPIALLLILALLFWTYGNILDASRVFVGVPLGWVGGIFALWLRDMPFSISAAIGFIAMSGLAVLDDMILVSTITNLRRKGMSRDDAVRTAALMRLRPVLMTTLVASLGFVPMALSTGMGAEVQRPLATVVIGGVISAMIMSLLVIRVLYLIFDSAAEGLLWFCRKLFGIEAEQLTWLVGDVRGQPHT